MPVFVSVPVTVTVPVPVRVNDPMSARVNVPPKFTEPFVEVSVPALFHEVPVNDKVAEFAINAPLLVSGAVMLIPPPL